MDANAKIFLYGFGIDVKEGEDWPRNPKFLPYNDEDFMLYAMRKNPKCVEKLGSALKQSTSFMIRILKESPGALETFFADRKLVLNEEFLLGLCRINPHLLTVKIMEAPASYRKYLKYKDIVLTLIEQGAELYRIANEIGDEFRNDPEFVMKLIDKDIRNVNVVGSKLRNDSKFMISLIDKIGAENVLNIIGDKLKYQLDFIKVISKKIENKELEQIIDSLYSTEGEKLAIKFNLDRKTEVNVGELLSRRAYYLQFLTHPEQISKTSKGEFGIMMDLVYIYPEIYTHVVDKLKVDSVFMAEAIKAGVPKELVKTECDKIRQANKLELQQNRLKKDPSEEEEKFREIANESIVEREEINEIANRLLSGEFDIYKFAKENNGGIKINAILQTRTDEDRKKLEHQVMDAIISGKLCMNDYIRLFSTQQDYDSVIASINMYLSQLEQDNPEFKGKDNPIYLTRKQIARLQKYEKPYEAKDFLGSKRGFTDTKTGETSTCEITEEMLNYVMKYLSLQDEYVCYNTVDETVFKLVKGEITREQIDEGKVNKIEHSKESSKREATVKFIELAKKLMLLDEELKKADKGKDKNKCYYLNRAKRQTINEMKGLNR